MNEKDDGGTLGRAAAVAQMPQENVTLIPLPDPERQHVIRILREFRTLTAEYLEGDLTQSHVNRRREFISDLIAAE